MANFKKSVFWLLLVELFILVTARIFSSFLLPDITFINIAVLSTLFLAVSLLSLFIFFLGRRRDEEAQGRFLLASFTIKFLSELVLAFLWFFKTKKTDIESLLLFFILYLAFTMLTMFTILKTLRYKNL